jgi:hypothetical protein
MTSTAQQEPKNPFLAAALAYATLLHWPVFPLCPRSKIIGHALFDGDTSAAPPGIAAGRQEL